MSKISALALLSAVAFAAAQSGDYNLLGCYSDSSSARALHLFTGQSLTMTIETCLTMCANAADGPTSLAGIEFGEECYCGNALLNENVAIDSGDCGMPCAGDSTYTETCGGANALQLYQYAGSTFTSGSPSILHHTSHGATTAATNSTSARQVPLQQNLAPDNMTVESCLDACNSQGYAIAALQYAQECWCSAGHLPLAGPQLGDSACNLQCTGNANEYCGGTSTNAVYKLPSASECTWACPSSTDGLPLFQSNSGEGQLLCYYQNAGDYDENDCYYHRATGALFHYDLPCPSTAVCVLE